MVTLCSIKLFADNQNVTLSNQIDRSTQDHGELEVNIYWQISSAYKDKTDITVAKIKRTF